MILKTASWWLLWALMLTQSVNLLATEFDKRPDDDTEISARAPAAPGNVRAQHYSPTVVELFWDGASDDQFVAAYQVFRDEEEVYLGDGRSFFEARLDVNRRYVYRILAIDNEGNRSDATEIVVDTGANSPGGTDGNANEQNSPSQPGNLRIQVYSPTAAELFWQPSSGNSTIVGYEIIRNGESLGVRDVQSYYEGWMQANREYLFEIIAVDQQGNRSTPAQVVRPAMPGGGSNPEPSSNGNGFELQVHTSEFSIVEGADSVVVPIRLSRNGSDNPIQLSVRGASEGQMRNVHAWFDRDVLQGAHISATLYLQLSVGMAPLQFSQRRLILSTNDGETSREHWITLNVTPVDAPDVYLLAGQSNMEGYSERGAKASWEGGADQPNPRVWQLNVQPNSLGVFTEDWMFTDERLNIGDPKYILAEDPLHEPRGAGRNSKEGSFVGLGLSFAKAALANTTADIYLVPAAWGASGFCSNDQRNVGWNAYSTGNSNFSNTRLTDRALTRLNMVLRDTGGILRGILWHQGEADSNSWVCAQAYAEHLSAMIQRFRNEARWDRRGGVARGADGQIPFILGTMSRGGEFAHFGEIKSIVDSTHKNISNAVPYAEHVNADDLVPSGYPCGDGSCIHFGAAALREMGFRYHSALRRVNLGE